MVKARRPLTTVVGACLAAVAAGCLVLFSILAHDATLGVPRDGSGVKVATPSGSAPVISLPGSSDPGGDGSGQPGDTGASDEPVTGPLALLLEPLSPDELVAQLGSPDGDSTGSTPTPPSAQPTAPGPGDDAVAIASERIEGRLRNSLDPDASDVRDGLRTLRTQDGGRPTPGDGGSEGPGKSNGQGKDKDKADNSGRGHGKAGDKSNKGGKGRGGDKGRASKPAKEKKNKASKAKGSRKAKGSKKSKGSKRGHSNVGGHQKTSSTGSTRSKPQKSHAPAHSTSSQAQPKTKAPKPAPSKAKSSPGHGSGGPPGQSKGKKKR